MFVYFNSNPCKVLTDDCAIRAISVVMGTSWKHTFINLCNRGLSICDMPNSGAAISMYLREKGFVRKVVPSEDCPSCYTIKDFCDEHPEGEYIVLTDAHAVAVINGNYYDTSDSGDMTPQYYWMRR